MENTEVLKERYELAEDRLKNLMSEQELDEVWMDYFKRTTKLLLAAAGSPSGKYDCDNEEISHINEESAYGNEENSYGNPVYAQERLGEELGRLLSFLYYETEGAAKNDPQQMMNLVIHMELFLEVYGAFVCERQESGRLPEYETIRQILYWFAFDYADVAAEQYVEALITGGRIPNGGILYDQLPDTWKEDEGAADPALTDTQHDSVHSRDIFLLLDKAYVSRKLEVLRTAFEQQREKLTACHIPEVVKEGMSEAGAVRMEASGHSGADLKLHLWMEYRAAVKRLHQEMLNR